MRCALALAALLGAACATVPPAATEGVAAPWPQPDPRITATSADGGQPATPTPRSPVPVPPLKPDLVPPPPRL
jgi:hypothetical protein